jgi:predicted membrane-bound spermidine synthase
MTRAPAAPYGLFFLSGISGLVYQVVWVREFGNVFGNTVHSAALVTAVFMCGLGAGSYLAGAWADRRYARGGGALLAAYGWSEALVALLGVALALVLPRLGALSAAISAYTRGAQGFYELTAGASVLRYALAALLLAPITLLMGGTLTLLIRHLVASDLGRAGVRIGALYGLNTAGAALGCLLTDFALVPRFGLLRTQLFSAAINAGVGLAAIALARRAGSPAPAPPEEAPEGDPSLSTRARHAVALSAAAIALTGFAGMGMEIVWFRFLTGSMGGYRAVFSLLLAVILAGMWLGATLGGWLHRRFQRPAATYMVVEVLFVLTTLGLLASFDRADFDRSLIRAFRALGSPETGLTSAAQAWAMIREIARLVALPSIFMGCSFPLANANVQRALGHLGRRAGALYLANTAGSVLGSLVAGFVLLPALGAQSSVLVLAVVAGLAIVPLNLSTRDTIGSSRPVGPDDYALAGGVGVLALAIGAWGMLLRQDHLARRSLPDPLGERFLTVSEGPGELLAVSIGPTGDRRLWTNGHSMSTTNADAQRYMRAFVHLPLLQLDAPKRVLVICFGVGNTAHAVTLHPSVERIELADLSRNVLSHARYFADTNGDVLTNPRVSVFVNDGRQHLRMATGGYDLVTLEPPPIGYAGVSSLYSREFYEEVKSRLSPDGYATQWLPIDQLQAPETLSLVRAFLDVFPAAVLLSGERRDLVLMGTPRPDLALDPQAIARRLADRPLVAADLERVSLARPSELFGTFVASDAVLRRATAGAAPVTDDRPSMEYSVMSKFVATRVPPELFDTRTLFAHCPACAAVPDLDAHLRVLANLYASDVFLRFQSFAVRPVEVDLASLLSTDDGSIAAAILKSRYLQTVSGIDTNGGPMSLPPDQLAALAAYSAKHPDRPVAALRLGLAYLADKRPKEAEAALRAAAEGAPEIPTAHFALARVLRGNKRFEESIAAYRRGLALAPRDVPARLGLIDVLIVADHDPEVPAELARVLAIDPHNGIAHKIMCIHDVNDHKLDAARPHCKLALEGGARLDKQLLFTVFRDVDGG